MTLPFYQVDVFSAEAYRGNPVAVVVALDDEAALRLTTQDMAQFASWTNLSETTFILPPSDAQKADYRLRIFTPGLELPFAGHPTLGSCRAWLAHGGRPRVPGTVVQECGAGLVTLRIEGDGSSEDTRLAFAAPPLKRSGKAADGDVAAVCKAMALDASKDVVAAEWIENGPPWLALVLPNAEAVRNVKLVDGGVAAGDRIWGIVGQYGKEKGPGGADFEVRTFAPSDGIPEDPVTGSFSAGLATWFQKRDGEKRLRSFIVSQGTCIGRKGQLVVSESTEPTAPSANSGLPPVWIGGEAHVCISGRIKI